MTEDDALAIALRALGGEPQVDVMDELDDTQPVYADTVDEVIRTLHRQGLNDKQIAEHPSVPIKVTAVARRRADMGLESNHLANRKPERETRTREWWARRDATIADMVNDGYSDAETAKTIGVSQAYVRKSRKRQGLEMNRRQAPFKGKLTGEASERANDTILAMWKQGKEDREIAEVLGLNAPAVRVRRNKLGLAAHRPSHRPVPPERIALIAKVEELHALGYTDRRIAEEAGVGYAVAVGIRQRSGLIVNPAR